MSKPNTFKTNAPDGLPRWKEDLRLNATEAEQLYSMLFHVETQKIALETVNMVMKVSTYGAILEHILKKALKEPLQTSRNDKRGNPERLDDLFKHHLELNNDGRYYYPSQIYQFKIMLQNINNKWNMLKHQLDLGVGGGYIEVFYYLNVLVSYLSDTEIPVRNSEVAGFQIYKNALERLAAEEAQKEVEQKRQDSKPQDKSQDIKLETSPEPTSTSLSKEKRMPIIVCIDASARMRQSGAYDGALEWVRVMADDYRGYGFVDVCLIVSNSDFCSVSSFDTLGELNYKIELLPPIDLGEGRTNLSQSIRKGLVSMKRYMKIAQASVHNAKILVLTDSSEFVCSVLQENVSQICNSLNFPDEMRVDLYVYRYEQGRIDEKFKSHLQPFREALRCDAESLESMNVLDKGRRTFNQLLLFGIDGFVDFQTLSMYKNTLQSYFGAVLRDLPARIHANIRIGIVLKGADGSPVMLPITTPEVVTSSIEEYLSNINSSRDSSWLAKELIHLCCSYLRSSEERVDSVFMTFCSEAPITDFVTQIYPFVIEEMKDCKALFRCNNADIANMKYIINAVEERHR